MTARQIGELFHLLFLRTLFGSLPDKTLLAVKGGINLRFYFQSPRFSEDLDLDVATMARATLENRVDRSIGSAALVRLLKSREVELTQVTKPKQTETTQRWKIGLRTKTVEAHTKVEFSRRDSVAGAFLDKVDAEIANAHSVPAFLATHYRTLDAVRQKVRALAGRPATQARDVFDLHLLLGRADAPKKLDPETAALIASATTKAGELSYDHYASQVIAYLEPEHAEPYSSREDWENMQRDVIHRIEAMA